MRREAVSSSFSFSVQSMRVLTTCFVWFDERMVYSDPSSNWKSSS